VTPVNPRSPPNEAAFNESVFRLAPLAVMLAASLIALVAGWSWTAAAAAIPWALSLVIVGLPHGAADLAVTRRLCGGASTVRVFAIYFAGMAAVFGLFVLAPAPLIAVFVGLSVWHFGMAHADGQSPPFPARLGRRLAAALGRGAMVVGVPMAIWPEATTAVATRLLELVASQAPPGRIAGGFDPAAIRVAGLLLLAAAACALAVEAFAARKTAGGLRRTAATLVDLAVIGLLGTTTAPLFSTGVYFLVWHSWRHMRLLAPLVAGTRPADPAALASALGAIHLAALPLLLPTWGAILAGWWFLSPHHSLTDLAILSLAVYLVVTPSHDVLIDFLRGRIAADEPSATTRAPTASRSCAA
jgi:Brp/Blh family beta-carotene 15,15'-monooxygenase